MLCNHYEGVLSSLWPVSQFAKILDDLLSQDESLNETGDSDQIGDLGVDQDLDLPRSPYDRKEIAESRVQAHGAAHP